MPDPIPPTTGTAPTVSPERRGFLQRWAPGLATLLDYRRSWFVNDLIAGLVLTAILVPVGMGYAEASGLPAINGLYATILPLVAYAIFGPSRIMVLGPDSTLAAVIAALILPLAAWRPRACRGPCGHAGAAVGSLLAGDRLRTSGPARRSAVQADPRSAS
jgi:MFS superfamily sulfate permease-like transporter